jgi:periplasmic protein TonB
MFRLVVESMTHLMKAPAVLALVAAGLVPQDTLGNGGAVPGGPAGDPPISLSDAEQGSCSTGELLTARGCVTVPRIKKKVEPEFPPGQKRSPFPRTVMLAAVVETDGTVSSVQVVKSTAGAGAKELEESAVRAVEQWRYEPGRLGDMPVRISFTVKVKFTKM